MGTNIASGVWKDLTKEGTNVLSMKDILLLDNIAYFRVFQ
ncbi:hypothetical protein AGMMS49975_18200 [Clostridia bacterium]|nr:hypothetical protein AGMMS49975_18200 [Clostridia bacterium]